MLDFLFVDHFIGGTDEKGKHTEGLILRSFDDGPPRTAEIDYITSCKSG